MRRAARLRIILAVLAVAALTAVGSVPLRTAAQEATPGAMAADETRAVIEAYFDVLLARGDIGQYFAEDIVLTIVDTGQEVSGRQAVVDTIVALHQQIFDARPELTGLVVGEGTAAAELIFDGTHTGEFAGIAATGKAVRVPYAAFYELAEGQITALRLYGFASGVVLQLTAGATPAAGTPAP
jgi:predicted ester cyclase